MTTVHLFVEGDDMRRMLAISPEQVAETQRVTRRIALTALGTSALLNAGLALTPSHVAADDSEPASAVVGSWLIHSGPADKPLPITSLITYTPQGTCIQTTVSHPMRSPAIGVWTQLAEREFAVTFQAFAFDRNGHFTNVSQVRVQSVLDDGLDSYTGRFQTWDLADDGTPIRMTNSGLVAAMRIQLVRLETQT
jgi:hypothetical protein